MFKMNRERCGLCGKKLTEKIGIMQYRATNPDGTPELFSMSICESCADDIDAKHEDMPTQEVRDWMLYK